jgi:hypothetical protein
MRACPLYYLNGSMLFIKLLSAFIAFISELKYSNTVLLISREGPGT